MSARKRFLLSLVAIAACLAGVLVDLLIGGTMNWTAAIAAAAILPLAIFTYKRMQAERRLADRAAKKQAREETSHG